jgi:hypothetical protein
VILWVYSQGWVLSCQPVCLWPGRVHENSCSDSSPPSQRQRLMLVGLARLTNPLTKSGGNDGYSNSGIKGDDSCVAVGLREVKRG